MIRSAWIQRRGDVFTIHLLLSARPHWQLRPRASRLEVDLLDAGANWPSNQFLHAAVGPLGTVQILPVPGGRVRITIEVSGRCDYIVGRRDNELIVGLARRGASINLADAFGSGRAASARKLRRHGPAIGAAPNGPAIPEQVARAAHQVAPPAMVSDETRVQARPVVVVDPGHGGFDPGTRSEDGLLEKNLALQIAQRLAADLARRGIKPVMTRDSDVYLSLARRTAIANEAAAELFVSIHLNWSPNPGTAGIEVYYLNNTTDRATIRLARMENAVEGGVAPSDPNLHYILSDLRQQYKATQSAVLAQVMEQRTVEALQADFGHDIHGLGARRGPFYVLVGPEIPAVLVECGFLSNPAEAHRLATGDYQQVLADALAGAVVGYLNQDVSAGSL